MSPRTDAIREAATKLASDNPGITFDELRALTSEWMRAEAIMLDGFEPMVAILNYMFESRTGVKSFLRLGQREDGELATESETSNHAEGIANAITEATA